MKMFSRQQIAGLLNDSMSHLYHFMGTKIIQQRDNNLKQLSGNNVNNTELALASLGNEQVMFCYDRFTELMASFEYNIECEDEEAKKFLTAQLLETRRELIWEAFALAKITGVAALEVMWGKEKGQIIVKDFVPIDSDRILYELPENSYKYKLRIATFKNNIIGEEVDFNKIIDFQYYSVRINSPYGLGVGGLLAELVSRKELVEQIWFEIAKTYSTPVKVGKIPETADEIQVDEFFDVLKRMSKDAVFIMPPGFEMDVKNVAASGADSLITPLIDYYDEKISSLLLGESITGRELSNGSQTRDIIAADIAVRKALSMANAIANRLNDTIVKWLLAYNFPGETAKIVVSQFEDLEAKLDSYQKLKQLGVNIDQDWLAEKFGVPNKEIKRFGVNFTEMENGDN